MLACQLHHLEGLHNHLEGCLSTPARSCRRSRARTSAPCAHTAAELAVSASLSAALRSHSPHSREATRCHAAHARAHARARARAHARAHAHTHVCLHRYLLERSDAKEAALKQKTEQLHREQLTGKRLATELASTAAQLAATQTTVQRLQEDLALKQKQHAELAKSALSVWL